LGAVSAIPVGATQPFSAQICLVPDSNVTYTVDNIAGGNATVGTVSSTGLFTSPPTAGKHTVRVTDASLNRTSGGVVTVFSSITADYGSRAGTTVAIPADLFGYGRGESNPTVAARNMLEEGGLTVARTSAQIAMVYATQTPDWTKIDPYIATIQASGQHALLQLHQSPTWLQPSTGSCAGNVFAAPTDINQWAQIAVSYVAHMDVAFPGVVTDYEIGNEPNATGMCTTANHLNTYLAIYAAAPLMKAQAAQDGVSIRIGGPVVSGYTPYWIDALLTTSTTAPRRFCELSPIFLWLLTTRGHVGYLHGDAFDVRGGTRSEYGCASKLRQGTEDDRDRPATGRCEHTDLHHGIQHELGVLPGLLPQRQQLRTGVFNSLYTTDLLNSVYTGSARVPNKIFYFAGSAYPWFCLIGVVDSNNDCLYSAGATPAPYPQYFAYQLIASPQYLGLSQGGYMAKSISAPTGGGGLATTAFYTANHDALVITNPTSTPYNQITVTVANPGLAGTQGTLYQIVNGAQISTTPISFSQSGTSLTTTISVPGYSVQAVSLP